MLKFAVAFMLLCCFTLPVSATDKQLLLQLDTGGHSSIIRDIAFTPDSKYLVSAGDDKVIRVWDWQQQKVVRHIRGQIAAGDEGKIYAMALSPDGQWLAVGGWMENDVIRLFDFHSGELRGLLHGHDNVVYALAFSPDSRYLLSGSGDFSAILWDVKTQSQQQRLLGHTDDIYAVAFTSDGSRLVTGSYDHDVRLWSMTGELLQRLQGHEGKVRALATHQGFITSGSKDHSIRVWDDRSGEFLFSLHQDTQVGSLSFSPDGKYLLSGVGDGIGNDCHLWNMKKQQKIHTYTQHDNIVLATAFSPDGSYMTTAGGNNNEIHIWNQQGQQARLQGQGQAIWTVGFSKQGQQIAWGKTSSRISPTNRGNLEQQLNLQPFGIPQNIQRTQESNLLNNLKRSQSFSALQKKLQPPKWLRATTKFKACFLETETTAAYGYQAILNIQQFAKNKNIIERDPTNGYDHRAYSFTPEGLIISGGANGVLSLYNRQAQHLGDFVGHTGDIWAVAVSADGQLLLSGSDDQTLRLWHIQTQELLLTLFVGDKDWVAWTPQGYYTASNDGDQLIGWHINRGVDKAADYVTAEQLKKHFYRPDIVQQTIKHRSAKTAIAQAKHTDYDLARLLAKGLPPKFSIQQPSINSTVKQAKQNLRLRFDPQATAERIEVFVNGRLTQSRSIQKPSRLYASIPLQLRGGDNHIEIIAYNAIGKTRQDFNLTLLQAPQEIKGDLYVVAIGVSSYRHHNDDLNYADDDAIAISRLLKQQQGKQYRKVHVKLLADNQKTAPTSAHIQDALDSFQHARGNDTVLLFVAGHGVMQQDQYYFLPQNAQKKDGYWRSSTVIHWQHFQHALAQSRGRKILLLDTCHAGNAFDPSVLKNAQDANIIAISATDGASEAMESSDLGHGYFTYALIQGLKGEANSYPDKVITLKELDTFLSNEVRKLSNKQQLPVLNTPTGFKDFDFFQM